METIDIHDAKTHLSRLLERVQKGEEIMLAKAGVPIAKLVPITQPVRELGFLRAQLAQGSAIDPEELMAPLDEVELAALEQSPQVANGAIGQNMSPQAAPSAIGQNMRQR